VLHGSALSVLDAAGVEQAAVVASSICGQVALDLALAHPDRVAQLVLICTAVRGAPYLELHEGPTAELNALSEPALDAGDLDEVNRFDVWMWLDGPAAQEGRLGGSVRELFLAMNGRALRAERPGTLAEIPPAWPRLGEITVPTLALLGRLDAEDIQAINPPVAEMIPNARLV
jgi:pimeloyl-ACP methyl ester carboxylesterase